MANDSKAKTKLSPARAYSVAELTDYAEGAIVSRTLADKESGTVTIFAFDAGQGLSEHTTPFDTLVHIVEGTAEVTIAGEPVKASAGQIVLMPANVPHALKALEPFKMLLIMLRSKNAVGQRLSGS